MSSYTLLPAIRIKSSMIIFKLLSFLQPFEIYNREEKIYIINYMFRNLYNDI